MQRLNSPKLEREPQSAVGAIRFEWQPGNQFHNQRHHITGPDQHFGPRVKRHRRQHLPGSGYRNVPRHGGIRFRLGFVLHRAVAPKLPDLGGNRTISISSALSLTGTFSDPNLDPSSNTAQGVTV